MDSNIKAIIFDFDGTLINSVDVYREYLLKWGNKFGGKITKDDFLRLNGRTISQVLRILIREGKMSKRAVFYLLFHQSKLKAQLKEETYLYPHVKECLQRLKGKYRLAIATSGRKEHFEYFAHRFGLMEFFEITVTREDVKERKPAPEPFLKAARGLGIDPENCMVIEDSPNGVLAGNKAGMKTCTVLHTTPQVYFKAEFMPDIFIENLSELMA